MNGIASIARKIFLVILTLGILAFATSAIAGSVSLAWDAPTTRTDGSAMALSEIANYRVYYGQASHTYTLQKNVANPGTLIVSTQITSLTTGTWYFAVTVFDVTGVESGYSNEVSKLVPLAPPSPVTALTGVVTGVGVN